jgi:Zn-dependent protease with chaperone function
VVFDPLVDMTPGGNALMIHEATHAKQRHALWGIVVGILTLGLAYRWWRMRCEREADKMALRLMGYWEFKRFAYMHPHPETKLGMYLYCATPEARIVRAAED